MNLRFWKDFLTALAAALALVAIILAIFIGLMWIMGADVLPWLRPLVAGGVTIALVVAWKLADDNREGR